MSPAHPAQASAEAADPPSRQRRKEARPQELLDAALALFAEKGFAAARSEEVAQRAGVSKGTLYLYYPSKEDLFKAVVRQNLSSLIAHGEEIAAQFDGSSAELLSVLMNTWWDRVGNTPAAGIHKVAVAEAHNFPEIARFYTEEVIVPGHRLFAGCVQRGIERGEFRPLPLQEVAQALIAPVLFMTLCRCSFGEELVRCGLEADPAKFLQTHLEITLRGLQAQPGPRKPA